ncbi:hypothetical protein [Mesoflavibacter zeaxanthinifaciens]|uniref:hypothetical protein n=1 Tax=Mesoflavibacter zeaxanthinifaciens TaxID=393060 RepID=UPI0026EC7BA6|nr:hypothetical protein [Mesoflavibacter zeaxanthinifaciens]
MKNSLFKDKSKEIERDIAILLAKVTHHIHPEIVKYIAEKNIDFKKSFEEFCHPNLNFDDFFYQGSDCVFPGIRRPINSEKKHLKKWKNNIYEKDGTIFNDNTYPRHLWTYLAVDKLYTGALWKESSLNQFELAHVFGHKEDERELEKKVFENFDSSTKPYSLFTSASNVVLIPKGFAKPTDQMINVKKCFYKRHLDLYGNNIIGIGEFNNSFVPDWYDQVECEWEKPILPLDWKLKIDNLLKYREKHLKEKYDKYLSRA